MEGRNRKRTVKIPLLLLIVLISLLISIPTVLANDQIGIMFDPHPSDPPYAPINPDPPDGALNVGIPVTLSVDVYDITIDPVDVFFYDALNDTLIGVDYNVPSDWSTASVVWNGLQEGQVYSWYAIARAHGYESKSDTWVFTTKDSYSPPSSPPGGDIPPPLNQPPIANITGSITGYVNETLVFHAYNSYDPDGNIIGYRWDFENDGVFDTDWLEDVLITCNYSSPGNYTILLEVKDDDGANATASHTINIVELEVPLQLPIPRINGPYHGYTNESITFSSNGSYDPDGTIINFTWYFGDGNKSYLENPVHSYNKSGNYTVILKVTDNDNLGNITTTKAIIIDKEIKKPEKEKEKPLTFLLFLFILLIVTIILLIFFPRDYRFTLLVEKINSHKKSDNNDRIVETKPGKKTTKNKVVKVDKRKDTDVKQKNSKDIHGKVDELLSKLN